MSRPIDQCLVARAARNLIGARDRLKADMKHNKALGHFSVWPCQCDPPCQVTAAEAADLLQAMPECHIFFQFDENPPRQEKGFGDDPLENFGDDPL